MIESSPLMRTPKPCLCCGRTPGSFSSSMVEYLKLSHSVSLRDLASSVSENLDAFWECVAPASDDRMLSLVMDLFMAKQLNVTLEYAARNRDEVNRAWLYRSAK